MQAARRFAGNQNATKLTAQRDISSVVLGGSAFQRAEGLAPFMSFFKGEFAENFHHAEGVMFPAKMAAGEVGSRTALATVDQSFIRGLVTA